jgi:SPP1 family predicted phage head-tail adaptor
MDRRVTIEQPTATQDSFGEPDTTWSKLADVWAEVYPVRGSEEFEGQQVYAENTLGFRIRYRSDVTRKMRIVYENDTYDIASIVEPRGTRREVLEITARARAIN